MSEARARITEQEAERLLQSDLVTREAVRVTEQDGIVVRWHRGGGEGGQGEHGGKGGLEGMVRRSRTGPWYTGGGGGAGGGRGTGGRGECVQGLRILTQLIGGLNPEP